jgi:hypothetical protein
LDQINKNNLRSDSRINIDQKPNCEPDAVYKTEFEMADIGFAKPCHIKVPNLGIDLVIPTIKVPNIEIDSLISYLIDLNIDYSGILYISVRLAIPIIITYDDGLLWKIPYLKFVGFIKRFIDKIRYNKDTDAKSTNKESSDQNSSNYKKTKYARY